MKSLSFKFIGSLFLIIAALSIIFAMPCLAYQANLNEIAIIRPTTGSLLQSDIVISMTCMSCYEIDAEPRLSSQNKNDRIIHTASISTAQIADDRQMAKQRE